MLPIEIRRVRSKKDRAVFVTMPWKLYRNDSHWVPPLVSDQMAFIDPSKGVFFDHGEAELFLVYRGAQPVGRISAHINLHYDEYYNDAKGFVGFFECEDDLEASQALFRAAESWLSGRGRKVMEGPMSFGVYDETGILVKGFDTDPYVLTSHNPPYYQRLFEAAGWEKSIDWYAFRGRASVFQKELSPKYFVLSQRVLKRNGIAVRTADLKHHLDREADIVKSIFATAWSGNWGHVPLTDREFERLKDGVRQFVVPELTFIVELEGKPIAFALAIYDANVAVKKVNGRLFPFGFVTLLATMKKTRRFRLVLMGVLEEYRHQGIEVAMYSHVIQEGMRLGFEEVEMSMIVETNEAMISSAERMPVERYRTWRIYRKEVEA
ncbi:MAG TPA: GNAT family N-acetyltransferase [Spirochaetia bacterium]|nr:GNAT family N-acetyltransferase [Spirochaetia bacterium]